MNRICLIEDIKTNPSVFLFLSISSMRLRKAYGERNERQYTIVTRKYNNTYRWLSFVVAVLVLKDNERVFCFGLIESDVLAEYRRGIPFV